MSKKLEDLLDERVKGKKHSGLQNCLTKWPYSQEEEDAVSHHQRPSEVGTLTYILVIFAPSSWQKAQRPNPRMRIGHQRPQAIFHQSKDRHHQMNSPSTEHVGRVHTGGVTDLNKVPTLFGLIKVVFNLAEDLIVRLHFLIRRKHRRVDRKGFPPVI